MTQEYPNMTDNQISVMTVSSAGAVDIIFEICHKIIIFLFFSFPSFLFSFSKADLATNVLSFTKKSIRVKQIRITNWIYSDSRLKNTHAHDISEQ